MKDPPMAPEITETLSKTENLKRSIFSIKIIKFSAVVVVKLK